MTAKTMSAACEKNLCDPDCPDGSRTLGIIREFRKLYEDKMRIIEAEGSGDCTLQAKLSLQADWIRDLNEQNEMLVRAVEELEQEATERVIALEEKLRQSSSCACEVMNGYKDLSNAFQHVDALKEDVDTLLEFVKTSAIRQTWDVETLSLRTVSVSNIMDDILVQTPGTVYDFDKMQKDMALKDKNIKMLQQKLEDAVHCKQLMAAEVQKECDRCEELRKSMLDIRDALTAEVADKHDVILTLKRDVQVLEEQCKKADQQTHFKDDIIKELRKEIKQLKCEGGSYSFPNTCAPEPDALINKLNNVCDSIERKLAWSMLTPKPRYTNILDTYSMNTCSPQTPQTTQTRTRFCEASCQTGATNYMRATGVQCVPSDEVDAPQVNVCKREQKLAMLSQPPIPLPCALPAIPLPMPAECGFDVPELDTNKPCAAPPLVISKIRERGCQTVIDHNHVPIQCSILKASGRGRNNEERLLRKTSVRLSNKDNRYNMISPDESSTSEDITESLMTLQSLPSVSCGARFLRNTRPLAKEDKMTRSHKRPNDRLRLAALNIEKSRSYQTPRTSIYMDSRFHKFIQIQEENQPPRLCSASLINLTKILHNRPRHFVVDKVPTGRAWCKNACSCGTDKPITQATMREIARDADYLAVKAAIDISQNRRPETPKQQSNEEKDGKGKCKCKVSVDCCPAQRSRLPAWLPTPLRNYMGDTKPKRNQPMRRGANPREVMITRSFLYPHPLNTNHRRTRHEERRRRPEEREEIEEESSSMTSTSSSISSSSVEEEEGQRRVLKYRSQDDIEDRLRSQIVEEIVRKSMSKASGLSTDSAFKSSRSSKRRRGRKLRNYRRKEERMRLLSRPSTSDFEIFQLSTKQDNPFEDQKRCEANNKPPTISKTPSPSMPVLPERATQSRTTPSNIQNRITSLSCSNNFIKGLTDSNDKVSKQVSFSTVKPTLPTVPKITPSSPPIPCVSRMLRESQPRQVKRLPMDNKDCNAEYIHGLFEFLRKTKKLEAEIDRTSFTDTTTPSEISEGGKREPMKEEEGEEKEVDDSDMKETPAFAEDTREDIIKQIDWTEVAKLFH